MRRRVVIPITWASTSVVEFWIVTRESKKKLLNANGPTPNQTGILQDRIRFHTERSRPPCRYSHYEYEKHRIIREHQT
jgi:hypothetical protein